MPNITNKFVDVGDVGFSCAEYLHNMSGTLKRLNRSYDDRFAKTGAKIGDVTNARLPGQFLPTLDLSTTQFEQQALNDSSVPVALIDNYKKHIGVDYVDLTLSVDGFNERYGFPLMRAMAAEIEGRALAALRANSSNAVGTPGVAVNTNAGFTALVGNARQKLIENLANPMEKFYLATPPGLSTVGYTNTTNQFNPTGVIGDIQTSGKISDLGGFEWYETTLGGNQPASTYGGTPLVNGANQSGSTIVTDGWTSGATTITAGATVTFAGVNAINPETKEDLGYLKQFSVTKSVTDTAGSISLSVSPALIGPGDPRSNVTRLPADNTAITVLGASGATGKFGTFFHKDAMIFANVDMNPSGMRQLGGGAKNGGADLFTATLPDLNLSISVSLQFDIRSYQYLLRYDLLGGFAPLYPQLGGKAYFA